MIYKQKGNRKSDSYMTKMRKSIHMRGMNLLHFMLITGIMYTVWFTWYAPLLEASNAQTVSLSVCACYMLLFIFLLRTYNAYNIGFFRAGEVFYSQVLTNLFSNSITYVFACLIQLRLLPVWPVLVVFCGQTLVCAVWCIAANRLYFKLHPPMKTLIIYQTESDLEKLYEIVHFENRFDVQQKLKVDAMIYDILQALSGYQAVIVSGVEATLRNGIVKECIDRDINCYFIPHTGDIIIAGAKHQQSFSVPIMSAKRAMLRPEYAFAKRTLDILLAMISLILASPFMLITAAAIKACDHGPVLYKQIRLTKDGKRFKILKFRSMRVDAEKDGIARLAADHDDRITPVGRVIRAIRFDELPQIFNILMGDMSIVGPRPERPEIAAQYEKEMPAFNLRLQVKAGLTGTAQVYGRYNTEPQDKLKMDLMYINQMSLVEDLRLIFATVKILFMKESTTGVQRGQVTAVKQGQTMEKSA